MYQSALTNDELKEAAYIKECGETGSGTIIGTWLNGWTFLDDNQRNDLWTALRKVLDSHLTPLEMAQGASLAVGGPDYADWRDNLDSL